MAMRLPEGDRDLQMLARADALLGTHAQVASLGYYSSFSLQALERTRSALYANGSDLTSGSMSPTLFERIASDYVRSHPLFQGVQTDREIRERLEAAIGDAHVSLQQSSIAEAAIELAQNLGLTREELQLLDSPVEALNPQAQVGVAYYDYAALAVSRVAQLGMMFAEIDRQGVPGLAEELLARLVRRAGVRIERPEEMSDRDWRDYVIERLQGVVASDDGHDVGLGADSARVITVAENAVFMGEQAKALDRTLAIVEDQSQYAEALLGKAEVADEAILADVRIDSAHLSLARQAAIALLRMAPSYFGLHPIGRDSTRANSEIHKQRMASGNLDLRQGTLTQVFAEELVQVISVFSQICEFVANASVAHRNLEFYSVTTPGGDTFTISFARAKEILLELADALKIQVGGAIDRETRLLQELSRQAREAQADIYLGDDTRAALDEIAEFRSLSN